MRNTTAAYQSNSTLPTYHWLGQQPYTSFLRDMQQHTQDLAQHQASQQVWFCEHEPVYTTGKRGIQNNKGILDAPLIVTDRGGETTFHGTGQLMMYPMIILKDYHLSVRDYVYLLEESCIQLLASHNQHAVRDCGFPGVWMDNEKIAALGIRVSRGITSHGIALNVNTELDWFKKINPCGTSRNATTMAAQGLNDLHIEQISQQWFKIFVQLLAARLV